MSLYTSSGLDIQIQTIQIYQNHYPELINRVFIINGIVCVALGLQIQAQ